MGKAKLELKGFDEFYERLLEASEHVDEVAEKKFDECVDILDTELRSKAQAAGLAPRLVSQIQKEKTIGRGTWRGAVGWKSQKAQKGQVNDFLKVVFYNYGTPTRLTKSETQHLQVGGKWVTLGQSRGAISKHGFIKKAKTSANRKIKALMKNTLNEMLNNK